MEFGASRSLGYGPAHRLGFRCATMECELPAGGGPGGFMPRPPDAAPMAQKKRAAGKRGGVPENAIARFEPGAQVVALAGSDPLTERLRKALEAADGSVQKASRLGKYQLSTITLTCSLKAGFVVLDVSGALALTWTVPKP